MPVSLDFVEPPQVIVPTLTPERREALKAAKSSTEFLKLWEDFVKDQLNVEGVDYPVGWCLRTELYVALRFAPSVERRLRMVLGHGLLASTDARWERLCGALCVVAANYRDAVTSHLRRVQGKDASLVPTFTEYLPHYAYASVDHLRYVGRNAAAETFADLLHVLSIREPEVRLVGPGDFVWGSMPLEQLRECFNSSLETTTL